MASDMDLPRLAVQLAVLSVSRPASRLEEDRDAVTLCPEVNFAPRGYLDHLSFRFSDAHEVVQAVTKTWQKNGVRSNLETIGRLTIFQYIDWPIPYRPSSQPWEAR